MRWECGRGSWNHTSFHMRGKSQTIGDFTVSLPSQNLPTNEIEIVWDDRGQIAGIGSVSFSDASTQIWLGVYNHDFGL